MATVANVLAIVTSMLPSSFSAAAQLAALNAAIADAGRTESSVDITGTADTYRYAITIPPELITRVEVIASGETQEKEFYWWRALTGYLYIDAQPPSAGDTIRVHYYSTPSPFTQTTDTVPANIDPQKLAWLTVYYACLPKMQIAANTDPQIKELFALASNMRAEFMVRRPARQRAPGPHFANW